MWVISKAGFFSVVQKAGEDGLTIRARARADLETLRRKYLPTLGEIIECDGTDYRYRARATHADFATALAAIVTDIGYPNFKNAVAATQGHERADVYHDVWRTLGRISNEES
jgi:hypothetical protein